MVNEANKQQQQQRSCCSSAQVCTQAVNAPLCEGRKAMQRTIRNGPSEEANTEAADETSDKTAGA
jgi:hypothetical protein